MNGGRSKTVKSKVAMSETRLLSSKYRVLDLTEGGCLICGKILGDYGADVIKIEKPGGSLSRENPPFVGDIKDAEKSLFWFAFNANKRGITLDIESVEGQEVFKKLVAGADFVLESFRPGYMSNLDLDYEVLKRINPRIIMTSITPFGQTGPYSGYKASDLICWAMGGYMGLNGNPDRAPVWLSIPHQAYLHGGAEAAAATLIAHWDREVTGLGQHVDVSIQECVLGITMDIISFWDQQRVLIKRAGGYQSIPGADMRLIYECKDGYVICLILGGGDIILHRSSQALTAWASEENMIPDWLVNFDWIHDFSAEVMTPELEARVHNVFARFFLVKTKKELVEQAYARGILLSPVNSIEDINNDIQLSSVGYWVDAEHPELSRTLKYPSLGVRVSEQPFPIRRRAPLIGEHNREVYTEVLGMSTEQLTGNEDNALYRSTTGVAQSSALESIKVLDLGWIGVVPITASYLGNHGATVIRVESHKRPDMLRLRRPYKGGKPGIDRAGFFAQCNTSKFGISLDLSNPESVEVKRRLFKWADIVTVSYTAPALKKCGVDYESVIAINPDIVYLESSMLLHRGPMGDYKGYGNQASCIGGWAYVSGWPDRPPFHPQGAYIDTVAPRVGAATIMAALDRRRLTGKGAYIEQSQVECGVQFGAAAMLDYVVNGRVASRNGNKTYNAAPHGAYPCLGEDRWCTIAIFTEVEWQALVKLIGEPAWTKNAKFSTFWARKENEDELDRLLGQWTIQFHPYELMTKLQSEGVTAGVVQDARDILKDQQLRHRGHIKVLKHAVIGRQVCYGSGFKFSKSVEHLTPAPCLGQHNEYVYKTILGFSDDEVADFLTKGVITTENDLPDFKIVA